MNLQKLAPQQTDDGANSRVLKRLYAVRPAWRSVQPAREALDLPNFTLLHAGPPLADPRRPCLPLLSSATLCCLYEGWASDDAEAEQLITSGHVALRPAQEFDAVMPLAAVISPRTSLVEVVDLNATLPGDRRAWSLLGSGAGPQLRFGSRDRRILERMAWRDGPLADCLSALLAVAPVPLLPLAAIGLAGSDDLHASTAVANAALRAQLLPLIEAKTWRGAEHERARIAAMLGESPLFFLTLWMAACHLMLNEAADGGRDAGSTLVVALAGNGECLGIRLAGQPRQWITAPALPPAGPRLNPLLQAEALPVIGDSGMIDVAGFGGQALAGAPVIAAALSPWLPPDWRERPARLLAGRHPAFASLGIGTGIDAAAVAMSGLAPLIAIAMIDAAGQQGSLGRGLLVPPSELFSRAVARTAVPQVVCTGAGAEQHAPGSARR